MKIAGNGIKLLASYLVFFFFTPLASTFFLLFDSDFFGTSLPQEKFSLSEIKRFFIDSVLFKKFKLRNHTKVEISRISIGKRIYGVMQRAKQRCSTGCMIHQLQANTPRRDSTTQNCSIIRDF
jgi:hypothetical protein